VPVAERRAKAARETAKLAKKTGRAASPVVLDGRKIASTFWGKAWCDNLEAYSDYANRLPRGRTYVRNGSVVDLQINKGSISALVSGSELYRIEIKIKPLPPVLWKSIQAECAGKIDSLIELLQGKLSSAVMQIVTRHEKGLFPTPKEIDLDCSCPDWADLCKHVAASLYGVGAKFDQNPALLFLLRGVDPAELISKASAAEAVRQTAATTDGIPGEPVKLPRENAVGFACLNAAKHVIEDRTTWLLGAPAFGQGGGNGQTFTRGDGVQFGNLRVNREDLPVFVLGGFAAVDEEFLGCRIHAIIIAEHTRAVK